MKKQIPKFKSEAAERRFWRNHDSTEYMEWSEGDFDSERFDSESVNWELMKYLRWSRDRYQNWGGVE